MVFVLSPHLPLLSPLDTWEQKQSPQEGGAENLSSGLLVQDLEFSPGNKTITGDTQTHTRRSMGREGDQHKTGTLPSRKLPEASAFHEPCKDFNGHLRCELSQQVNPMQGQPGLCHLAGDGTIVASSELIRFGFPHGWYYLREVNRSLEPVQFFPSRAPGFGHA